MIDQVSVKTMKEWLRDITEVERLLLLAKDTKASLKQQYERRTDDNIEAKPVLEQESAAEASGNGLKSGFSNFCSWLFICLSYSYVIYIVVLVVDFLMDAIGVEVIVELIGAITHFLASPLTIVGINQNIGLFIWPVPYCVIVALFLGIFAGSSQVAGLEYRNKVRKDAYEAEMAVWRKNENNRQQSNAIIVSSRPGLAREYNTLAKTEDRLLAKRRELYSTGYLSSEYQNFQAVAAMYGYFTSGRCTAVYGHGGIVDTFVRDQQFSLLNKKLDVIINQLDNIKYSQVELYRAIIQNSRQLSDINSNIALYAQQHHEDMARISEDADRIVACQRLNASCLSTIAAIQTYEFLAR